MAESVKCVRESYDNLPRKKQLPFRLEVMKRSNYKSRNSFYELIAKDVERLKVAEKSMLEECFECVGAIDPFILQTDEEPTDSPPISSGGTIHLGRTQKSRSRRARSLGRHGEQHPKTGI